MRELVRKYSIKKWWLLAAAFTTAYALTADFSVFLQEEKTIPQQRVVMFCLEQLRGSVLHKGSVLTLLMIALACLYHKMDELVVVPRYFRFKALSAILSLCTVISYPYEIAGTISLMYANWFQVIKSLIFLCGYGFLMYFGIIVLYQYTCESNAKCNWGGAKLSAGCRRPDIGMASSYCG